ncbi:MAG: 4-hydroxythreonine-4-phosphate dehydrogenase PdxA [Spirochaetota bacterium]
MESNVLAVTMGDPGGVGPEIVLKALSSKRVWEMGVPVVVGDYEVLRHAKELFGIEISLIKLKTPDELRYEKGAVQVLDVGLVGDVSKLEIGKVTSSGGRVAFTCIKSAVELVLGGKAKGIVTAPINKEAFKASGYNFAGHTELIAELAGVQRSITMFMVDNLKIFFHTRHISLRRAIETLEPEGISESIVCADACLRSIDHRPRRIVLAALNPHASDGGLFGYEEERILARAIDLARLKGVDVTGPVPADSVFHLALQGKYDAVVSLYHDQGHIAAKTYDFFRTVSVTFGFPFMRTSVDHGTAFDIAWKGVANPESMIEAILACFRFSGKYNPSVFQPWPARDV